MRITAWWGVGGRASWQDLAAKRIIQLITKEKRWDADGDLIQRQEEAIPREVHAAAMHNNVADTGQRTKKSIVTANPQKPVPSRCNLHRLLHVALALLLAKVKDTLGQHHFLGFGLN